MTGEKIKFAFGDAKDIKRKIVFFLNRRLQPIINRGSFVSFGKKTIIYKPVRIMGSKFMSIGDNVTINKGAYLYALQIDNNKPRLSVGNGSTIGHFSHIVSVGEVIIGEKVLIADRVYIGDNMHNYEDIEVPIIDQGVRFTGGVYIGSGSWIGENVSIVSCSIGKHCVIGANSFVNRDIPDYSVAVGNPIRIIKQLNIDSGEWERQC